MHLRQGPRGQGRDVIIDMGVRLPAKPTFFVQPPKQQLGDCKSSLALANDNGMDATLTYAASLYYYELRFYIC